MSELRGLLRAACGPRDHLSGAAIGERVYAKHAVSWLAGALAELHSSRWTLSDELFDNPLKNPEGRALPAIPSTGVGRRKPRAEFVFGGDGPYSPSPRYANWRKRGMPADRTITQESSDLVSEDEIGQAGNLFHDFQIYFRPAIVSLSARRGITGS